MSTPLPGRILPLAPGTFRALSHVNFRRLWTGQLVVLTGRWMQSVAQGWLVLRLTDSALHLGLVAFFSYLPVLVFALPAGVAADRLPRRKTLLATQTAGMLLALVLAALTWSGQVRFWHVAAIGFAAGAASTFEIAIRQTFLQDLVGRDDLPNAIALNSLAFNGARFVGPAIGGVLVGVAGEATVFLLHGLSFVGVLVGVGRIRVAPHVREAAGSWLREALGGLAWVRQTVPARAFLVLVLVSSVFGLSYSILLPVFARDVLGVGSRGLGALMGATGLGAASGALYLAGRHPAQGRQRLVVTALAVLGAGLVGFAASRSFALSLGLLFVVGGAMLVQLASSNTQLQLLAPPEMRGRVISLYMLAFMGMAPVGSLFAGLLARAVGAPWTVAVGGAACLGAAAWGFSRTEVDRARDHLR